MAIPFIKKFKSAGKFYLYDINSNCVLNVDYPVYTLVDFYRRFSEREISEFFLSEFSPQKIKKALGEIRSYEKKGFFSDFRPKALNYHLPFREVKKRLESTLQQLILNVTENCNLRCAYCTYSGIYKYRRSHSRKRMPETTAYRAVDFFKNNSALNKELSIGFYGGEPLLNFRLIEQVVDYARVNFENKRLNFNITTNGTLITPRIIDYIVKNGIKLLISIDGPEKIHDRYRVFKGGKGTFKIIKSNLEKIIKYDRDYYHSKISFNIVFGPPYQLWKIYKFIERNQRLFGKNRISLSDVVPRDTDFFERFPEKGNGGGDYRKLEEKFFAGVVKGERIKNSFLRKFFENNLVKIYKRDIGRKLNEYEYPNGACIPGLRRIFVSTDGKFHICEKINEYLPIGDVLSGLDFKKIRSIMVEYAKRSSQDCCKCWALRLCSLCFIHALRDRMDFESKKQSCLTEEKSLLNGLKLYCRILDENPDALEYMKEIRLS